MLLRRASGLFFSLAQKDTNFAPKRVTIVSGSPCAANDIGALILGNVPGGKVFKESFDLLRLILSPRQSEQVAICRKKTIYLRFRASTLKIFLDGREIIAQDSHSVLMFACDIKA